MGVTFAEPAPLNAAALEALDIWNLMGNEMRLEALPAILELYPVADPPAMVELLRLIADAARRQGP